MDQGAEIEDRPPTPTISVIIPVHNGLRDVPEQLAALAQQVGAPPFEVILVDNRSTDGLRDAVPYLSAEQPYPLVLLAAHDIAGVSHARNVGLRASSNDIVLVCDADDRVGPHWVRGMVQGLQDNDLVGGVLDVAPLNTGPELQWRPMPDHARLPVSLQFLPYVQGCNVGVWRKIALDVGGWDEKFTQGGDDVDFAWRVQLAGGRVGTAPDAVVAYRYRRGLGATARQGFLYAFNDHLLLSKFADHGLRPRSEVRLLRNLLRDLLRLPIAARTMSGRGAWLYRAAVDAGALAGQLRFRTDSLKRWGRRRSGRN